MDDSSLVNPLHAGDSPDTNGIPPGESQQNAPKSIDQQKDESEDLLDFFSTPSAVSETLPKDASDALSPLDQADTQHTVHDSNLLIDTSEAEPEGSGELVGESVSNVASEAKVSEEDSSEVSDSKDDAADAENKLEILSKDDAKETIASITPEENQNESNHLVQREDEAPEDDLPKQLDVDKVSEAVPQVEKSVEDVVKEEGTIHMEVPKNDGEGVAEDANLEVSDSKDNSSDARDSVEILTNDDAKEVTTSKTPEEIKEESVSMVQIENEAPEDSLSEQQDLDKVSEIVSEAKESGEDAAKEEDSIQAEVPKDDIESVVEHANVEMQATASTADEPSQSEIITELKKQLLAAEGQVKAKDALLQQVKVKTKAFVGNLKKAKVDADRKFELKENELKVCTQLKMTLL